MFLRICIHSMNAYTSHISHQPLISTFVYENLQEGTHTRALGSKWLWCQSFQDLNLKRKVRDTRKGDEKLEGSNILWSMIVNDTSKLSSAKKSSSEDMKCPGLPTDSSSLGSGTVTCSPLGLPRCTLVEGKLSWDPKHHGFYPRLSGWINGASNSPKVRWHDAWTIPFGDPPKCPNLVTIRSDVKHVSCVTWRPCNRWDPPLVGSGARARDPSRCTCDTHPAWWHRYTATPLEPKLASAGWPRIWPSNFTKKRKGVLGCVWVLYFFAELTKSRGTASMPPPLSPPLPAPTKVWTWQKQFEPRPQKSPDGLPFQSISQLQVLGLVRLKDMDRYCGYWTSEHKRCSGSTYQTPQNK